MKIVQVGKTDKNFYANINKLKIQFYTAELFLLKLDQFGFSEGLTYYINENEINDVATLINFVRFYSKSCELEEKEIKEANDFLDTLDLAIDKIDRVFPWNKKIIKEVQEFVDTNYISSGTREYVATLIQLAKEKWPKKGSTKIDGLLSPQEVSELTGLALKTLSMMRWRKQPPTYVKLNVKENNNKKMVFYNAGSVLKFMNSKKTLRKIKKHLSGTCKGSLQVESPLCSVKSIKGFPSYENPTLYPIAPIKGFDLYDPDGEETVLSILEVPKEPTVLWNSETSTPMLSKFKELEKKVKELNIYSDERDIKLRQYIYNRNNSIKQTLYVYNEKIKEFTELAKTNNEMLGHKLSTHKKNMYDYIDERLKVASNSNMEIRIKIGDLEEKINEMRDQALGITPEHRAFLATLPRKERNLLTPIKISDLSVRSYNALKNFYTLSLDPITDKIIENYEPINCIGALVSKTYSELLKMPGIGQKSLNEIKEFVSSYDLHLGTKLPDWWKTQNIKILSDFYMREDY